METEILKIAVAQRILGLSNRQVLEKVKDLLDKENVFAYDVNGLPISEHDYIEDLNALNVEIDTKEASLKTTFDVLKPIADDNKLAL
ncbi:hypothetical protein [Gelidibacter mesophilus]|uniref:hypothetical protein n=1 Tax=Gelidibacter mesophilus TaxID=169050 RepID=UPI00040C8EAA|nr:hypothetical protein [Gelidibacter mesophilus]